MDWSIVTADAASVKVDVVFVNHGLMTEHWLCLVVMTYDLVEVTGRREAAPAINVLFRLL